MAEKRYIFFFLFLFVVLATSERASAEIGPVQRAFESVKDSIGELSSAKDENNASEVAFRVELIKKIIDLAIAETKDLKSKLLVEESQVKEVTLWRETAVETLDQALAYYDEEKQAIAKIKSGERGGIKSLAQEFKNWREKNYLPVAQAVNDFLLIHEEEKAIQTTQKRYQKINEDVVKFQKAKAKIAVRLDELLGEAETLIKESGSIHEKAEGLFFNRYIIPLVAVGSPPITTETPEIQQATEPSRIVTTSTIDNALGATTTSEVPPRSTPPTSIRGLVKDSLSKIKETYQVFIEMSNLVRGLPK